MKTVMANIMKGIFSNSLLTLTQHSGVEREMMKIFPDPEILSLQEKNDYRHCKIMRPALITLHLVSIKKKYIGNLPICVALAIDKKQTNQKKPHSA